ncbi:MAG: 2-phospho-L-lactate guanylyltransferase [Methanobacteriaceae archaeon]|nr:2-phospho-L-lactate guanylyltransferase [Methanobacteriaceae archaeon]
MKKTAAIIPVSRFTQAKTRLSPALSPPERENLLKAMLKDVVRALKDSNDLVLVISSDRDVLDFLKPLSVKCLREEGETDLNGALMQAVAWCSGSYHQVLIVPSDVPLLCTGHVQMMREIAEEEDVVIAPAKGGGTNALLCPSRKFPMRFGDFSFFKHIKEAEKNGLSFQIFDSFYLSLDVNTAEDLGEIMLHGAGTHTQKYLESLGLSVHSHRGSDRLRVERSKNSLKRI